MLKVGQVIRLGGRCGSVVGKVAAWFGVGGSVRVGRIEVGGGVGLIQGEGLRWVVGVEGEVEGEVGGGDGFGVLD